MLKYRKNNEKPSSIVLNLQDSISRIIDNIGFSSVERNAHTKLMNILVEKMFRMSTTLRLLAENANKETSDLNIIDLCAMLKLLNIDPIELIEYERQVAPFPPDKSEIHPIIKYEIQNSTVIRNNVKNLEISNLSQKCQPKKIKQEIPRFDGMDEFSLGFSYHKPATFISNKEESPVRNRPVGRPPNKRGALQTRIAEEFQHNYYTPINSKCSKASKSSPDIRDFHSSCIGKPNLKLSTKLSASKSSVRVLNTKRRMYLKNHERRLREESEAAEEKRLDDIRRRNEEVRRKLVEKKRFFQENNTQRFESSERAEYEPFDEIKTHSESIQKLKDKEKHQREVRCEIKENKTILLKIKPNLVPAEKDNELYLPPLPKIKIEFRRLGNEKLHIKKISMIRFRERNNRWKSAVSCRKIGERVISDVIPNVKRQIPKIFLRKNANGKFAII